MTGAGIEPEKQEDGGKAKGNQGHGNLHAGFDTGRGDRHHTRREAGKCQPREIAGYVGVLRGLFIAQDDEGYRGKDERRHSENAKGQRQVRKVSTRPPKSGPPKAEMPQTTDRMAISCGQMRVGKYLCVATKESDIKAPPPKPLMTRPMSRMGMLGASAVIVQPIAKMMAATIILLELSNRLTIGRRRRRQ